jgi:hypothetical protein
MATPELIDAPASKGANAKTRGKQKTATISFPTAKAQPDEEEKRRTIPEVGPLQAIRRMAEDYDVIPAPKDMKDLLYLASDLAEVVYHLGDQVDRDPRDARRIADMKKCVASLETGAPLNLSPLENKRLASRHLVLLFHESQISAECEMEEMTGQLHKLGRAERGWEDRQEAANLP